MTRWSMAFKILTILDSIKYAKKKKSGEGDDKKVKVKDPEEFMSIGVLLSNVPFLNSSKRSANVRFSQALFTPYQYLMILQPLRIRSSTNMSTWLDF